MVSLFPFQVHAEDVHYFSLVAQALLYRSVQEVSHFEQEPDSLRVGLVREDVKNAAHGVNWVEFNQVLIKPLSFEKAVVEQVIDKVQKELCLELYLFVVLLNSAPLSWGRPQGKQDVDDYDYGT